MNTHDISAIDGMEGHEFEYFCAAVLRKVGFSDVSVTPGSGDQGVDVLATKDGIKYAIQCKNFAKPLSNTPVQEVAAGKQFYGCHVGVVMTNSTFTPGAIQLATATNVILWDRTKLKELISMAGGLEEFGVSPAHKKDNDKERSYIGSGTPTVHYYIANSNRPRTGMSALSYICYAWSVICAIMLMAGIFANETLFIMMGLGEGLFVLVFGVMFSALAKSPKGNPYITICGKNISKTLFVILCIVIAYVCFLGALGIMGGFDVAQ